MLKAQSRFSSGLGTYASRKLKLRKKGKCYSELRSEVDHARRSSGDLKKCPKAIKFGPKGHVHTYTHIHTNYWPEGRTRI